MDNMQVPVSPGEVLDKITILEIKSERMSDPDKVANVRRVLRAPKICDHNARHGFDGVACAGVNRHANLVLQIAFKCCLCLLAVIHAKPFILPQSTPILRLMYLSMSRRSTVIALLNAPFRPAIVLP